MITNFYQIINMDSYYCLIKLKSSSAIVMYLFHNHNLLKYPLCIISDSSNVMHQLINSHDIFMQLSVSHILYLGQELYKAEVSLQFKQHYIQY